MFKEVPLNPGVYIDDTPAKAQGFFINLDKVRFVRGLPQVFGGWELLCSTALNGKCRNLHAWLDHSLIKWLAAGTHSNAYILSDGLPYDVTPVATYTQAVSISFTTVLGSASVVADWTSHGLVVGQGFLLDNSTVATIGGVTINSAAATVTSPSPQYVVTAVNTVNQVTFTAAQTATASAGPTAAIVNVKILLAPGLSDGIGALGYGTGLYSTSSSYSSPASGDIWPRTWSLGNYGQNLIGSPRNGKIYELAPITNNTELVTNGSFTGSASGWTVGANWAYGANAVTATLSNAALSQALTLNANAFYLVEFVLSGFAAGTLAVTLGTTTVGTFTALAANATYRGTAFASASATLAFTGTGFTGTIDSVSVKQLTTLEGIPNAPTQNTIVLVTAEGFVMTFGTVEAASGNFNPMHIRWSDIGSVVKGEQAWTPSSTNLSSFVTLGVGSRIVGAKVSGTEILVWTDEQFYAGSYVNNSGIVYSFRPVGSKSGLIGANAAAVTPTGAYWMTPTGTTLSYSGGIPMPIKSTMSRDVFTHLALVQQDKIAASSINAYNEVIWLYPDSRDGTECSRYTLLATLETVAPPAGTNPGAIVGCFANGTFDRTAIIDAGIYPYPIMADSSGNLYYHEKGNSANGAALSWTMLTGSIQIGDGATLWQVKSFIPDFSGLLGGATLTAYGYKYPQSTPTTTGPFAFNSMSEKIDMLVGPPIGREVSFQFDGNSSPAFMRTGKLMMDIEDTGMSF